MVRTTLSCSPTVKRLRLSTVLSSIHTLKEKICSSSQEKTLTAFPVSFNNSSHLLVLCLILFPKMSFLEAGLGTAFPSQCFMAHEPNPDCAVTDAARNLTCPIPEEARIPPCCCRYSHTHLCPMPGFAKTQRKFLSCKETGGEIKPFTDPADFHRDLHTVWTREALAVCKNHAADGVGLS